MREVLLLLAMTSNGRTVSYDSSGGGTVDYALVDDRGRGKLDAFDAPHLRYVAEWNAAEDDARRREVLELARAELNSILKSQADPLVVESREERDRRIVDEGEGWPLRDVANSFRCGTGDVRRAREAAGRDIEYGHRRRNGRELTTVELRAEVSRLAALKMSEREIARALNIAHGSVRYILARARARG